MIVSDWINPATDPPEEGELVIVDSGGPRCEARFLLTIGDKRFWVDPAASAKSTDSNQVPILAFRRVRGYVPFPVPMKD